MVEFTVLSQFYATTAAALQATGLAVKVSALPTAATNPITMPPASALP